MITSSRLIINAKWEANLLMKPEFKINFQEYKRIYIKKCEKTRGGNNRDEKISNENKPIQSKRLITTDEYD